MFSSKYEVRELGSISGIANWFHRWINELINSGYYQKITHGTSKNINNQTKTTKKNLLNRNRAI